MLMHIEFSSKELEETMRELEEAKQKIFACYRKLMDMGVVVIKESDSSGEDIISQRVEPHKGLKKSGEGIPAWEVFFEHIAVTYSQMRSFDAMGIAGTTISEAVGGLVGNKELSLKKTTEIAALLKLEEVAMLSLNWDTLLPEERRMLSGQFVTSLGDVKNLLLHGLNPDVK